MLTEDHEAIIKNLCLYSKKNWNAPNSNPAKILLKLRIFLLIFYRAVGFALANDYSASGRGSPGRVAELVSENLFLIPYTLFLTLCVPRLLGKMLFSLVTNAITGHQLEGN